MADNSSAGAIERLGITIREAEVKDISEIYEIETLSFGDEAYDIFLLHLYLTLARETFLVAQHGDRIVGYIIGVQSKWGEGHIISVAAHPSFRRRGVASALLTELLRKFKNKGAKTVRLEVKVSNLPAINLYKKFGFKPVGLIKGYYPSGEDAYLMVVELQ